MIALTEHIEYLLTQHECVIVPDLGAFIVRYVPARWDSSQTTLLPPSKCVAFNPSVTDNDGLLVNSVRRRHSLPYEKAVSAIADEVATMRHQLDTDGEISLGRLGSLTQGSESTLEFVPRQGDSLVDSRYEALPPVKISTIISRAKADDETDDEIAAPSNIFTSATRRLIRIAASVILLIGIGFVASTPILLDDHDVNKASVAAPTTISLSEPAIKEVVNQALSIAIPDASVSTSVVDTVAHNRYRNFAARKYAAATSSATTPVVLRSEVADRYCLVVASLTTMEEADKYMKAHRGLNLLVQDGKYRIYAATANSSTALRNNARNAGLFARYPDAWICTRY